MATNARHGFSGNANRTTHSREDALDDVEFERLFEGASSLEEYYAIQARFLVLVCGRLGLRRGEFAHIREDWIDWRNERIVIPRQTDCHGGKDGGACGLCRQLARQRADHHDELTFEDALRDCWSAKTDAAAREVYFGYDARLRLYIERFFDRFEGWVWSGMMVNRRLERAAEAAREIDPDDVRPHSLRATAATRFAGRGLSMHSLQQVMGWAQPQTAEVYLARDPESTARQLDAIHQ